MAKNEALEKTKKIIDNDKRKIILEKRICRLENMIKNESVGDPASLLLYSVDDGYVSWETLCRELIAIASDDDLLAACRNLYLLEDDFESCKCKNHRPAKNESFKKHPVASRLRK